MLGTASYNKPILPSGFNCGIMLGYFIGAFGTAGVPAICPRVPSPISIDISLDSSRHVWPENHNRPASGRAIEAKSRSASIFVLLEGGRHLFTPFDVPACPAPLKGWRTERVRMPAIEPSSYAEDVTGR